jgi:hypothetical protein
MDDFDFVEQYGEPVDLKHENTLPDNEAGTALNTKLLWTRA